MLVDHSGVIVSCQKLIIVLNKIDNIQCFVSIMADDCELGWSIDNPNQLNFMGFVINLERLSIVNPTDLPTHKKHQVLRSFTNVLNHKLSNGTLVVYLTPFDISAKMMFSLCHNNSVYEVYIDGKYQGYVRYMCIPRDKIQEFTEYNIKTVVPDITASAEAYIRYVALESYYFRMHASFRDIDFLEVFVYDITTTDIPATENSVRIVKQVISFDIVCWGPRCVFGTKETKTIMYENGCHNPALDDMSKYYSRRGYTPETFKQKKRLWSSVDCKKNVWFRSVHFVDAQTNQIVPDDYEGPVKFVVHHPHSGIKSAAK